MVTPKDKNSSYRWKFYIFTMMTVWTAIIAASIGWNFFSMKHHAVEMARSQANMAYTKNVIYRRWNTEHGGVYVEVKEGFKPNPYLKVIPERDVVTPSGKVLTLINPALMMREVYEITKRARGSLERLVSIAPLNPDNLADPWEVEAIKSFKRGSSVVSNLQKVDGVENMRLIRPLFTEKSCLKCHASQGYVEGDLQGAISIMLPMAPIWASTNRTFSVLAKAHALLWFLGAVGILLAARRLRRTDMDRTRMAEELLKAQKLESLGMLAGGIAHDYNNLLTSLIGNVSLASRIGDDLQKQKRTEPGDLLMECLRDAGTATGRARDLTRQLITFSKGGAPLKELVIDTGKLIRNSVDFALVGSNVICGYYIPAKLFSVEVDAGQITQVLHNIVINAAQAMPDGGKIEVRAKNLSAGAKRFSFLKPGRFIKISVKDYGSGIPEEILDKVFDPYFTTKKGNSGLGLASAYSIINKHDGYIDLESEVDAGTTFSIYLPATARKTGRRAAREAPVPEPTGDEEMGGRILIMDDDELVRNVVCRILSRSGYEVVQAKDGDETIDIYIEARVTGCAFDLVILDVTMSGGKGAREVVKELIELDIRAKAIVSTGYSDDSIKANYKNYGFKGVVSKPYGIEELRRAVRAAISSDDI
jgi:signal transduction histidine kinase/CheY-like chemotaxis protein